MLVGQKQVAFFEGLRVFTGVGVGFDPWPCGGMREA